MQGSGAGRLPPPPPPGAEAPAGAAAGAGAGAGAAAGGAGAGAKDPGQHLDPTATNKRPPPQAEDEGPPVKRAKAETGSKSNESESESESEKELVAELRCPHDGERIPIEDQESTKCDECVDATKPVYSRDGIPENWCTACLFQGNRWKCGLCDKVIGCKSGDCLNIFTGDFADCDDDHKIVDLPPQVKKLRCSSTSVCKVRSNDWVYCTRCGFAFHRICQQVQQLQLQLQQQEKKKTPEKKNKKKKKKDETPKNKMHHNNDIQVPSELSPKMKPFLVIELNEGPRGELYVEYKPGDSFRPRDDDTAVVDQGKPHCVVVKNRTGLYQLVDLAVSLDLDKTTLQRTQCIAVCKEWGPFGSTAPVGIADGDWKIFALTFNPDGFFSPSMVTAKHREMWTLWVGTQDAGLRTYTKLNKYLVPRRQGASVLEARRGERPRKARLDSKKES